LSHPADPLPALGVAFMVLVMVAGLVLLWRLVLSPAARAARPPAVLAPWPGGASDLLLFFFLAIAGAILLPFLAVAGLRHTSWGTETRLVLSFAAFQVGMLAGIAAFFLFWARDRIRLAPAAAASLRSGLATVLIAFPLVQGVALAWQALLGACGLPVETPDNVQIFMDLHSPLLRVLYVLLAIVVAPLTEELLFRAGLFRYFRGRFPRWIALWLPALVFGAMHLTRAPLASLSALAPLVVLGVILSLAYERTGRIGTAIVAHSLFNLITVCGVLLGVNT
jgi:membrane protease YdiL (CAAX protease family)